MGRKCKVCSSPHRMEYEKMKLEKNMDVADIWRIAVTKYGEKVSYTSFCRHFKNHVEYYLKLQKAIKEEKQKLYQRVIRTDMLAAERLAKNLEICSQRIEELAKKRELSVKDQEILLRWLSETRLLTEKILEWGSKIDFTVPEEEEGIVDIVKKVIADFPEEYQITLIERLENYVREKYQKNM